MRSPWGRADQARFEQVLQAWWRARTRLRPKPEEAMRFAVRELEKAFPSRLSQLKNGGVPGAPFDSSLLLMSPLYRRSRLEFNRIGGRFVANLISSPRGLGSVALLDPVVEYTPWERELRWAAHDRLQGKERGFLLGLRQFGGSLFHEQNHRILWSSLQPPPLRGSQFMRRYLNFAESLVIGLDFALGDQIFPASEMFWQFLACYDPGTSVLRDLSPGRRAYRNYLHAAVYATYLTLELYDPKRIPEAVEQVFSGQDPQLTARAARRAVELDEKFVVTTNRIWQKRHALEAQRVLSSRLRGRPLTIPEDPLDYREQYLVAEAWFERFDL